jgi:hypothetical protein
MDARGPLSRGSVYRVQAEFCLRSPSKYHFEVPVELDGVRLETRDGKVCGEVTMSVADPARIEQEVCREVDRVALLLTLQSGEGFAVEDFRVRGAVRVSGGERGDTTEVRLEAHVVLKVREEVLIERTARYTKERLERLVAELRELSSRLSKLGRGEDILRAVRWWRKGYLEEDRVDRFLHYYIAFEILASVKGYKSRYKDWAKRFSEDYSITYRPDGKTSVRDIRSWLVHEPGQEKDRAEELARQYADRFGAEVLRAIKRIIDEAASTQSPPPVYVQ